MQIAPGSIVRPVISIAGLDSRKQYRVRDIIAAGFTSIAYLEDSTGALVPPVENALMVLERVTPAANGKPSIALFN